VFRRRRREAIRKGVLETSTAYKRHRFPARLIAHAV
jgi:hypothetical protein